MKAKGGVVAKVLGSFMTVTIHLTKTGSRDGELEAHVFRCTPPEEVKKVWEQLRHVE